MINKTIRVYNNKIKIIIETASLEMILFIFKRYNQRIVKIIFRSKKKMRKINFTKTIIDKLKKFMQMYNAHQRILIIMKPKVFY